MSKIEWTERTWNPVTGCSRVSRGCENCYAERMAWRLSHNPVIGDRYAGTARKTHGGKIQWTGKVNLVYSAITQPYAWRKPSLVFVNSMSDFFHPDIPQEFLNELWNIIRDTPQHTYQILTKRPKNILDRLPANWEEGYPNVWIGTSVEDQRTADERIARLIEVPAAVRFLSMEPLLSPVDLLGNAMWLEHEDSMGRGYQRPMIQDLQWVIVGGESGPGARACDPDWIADIVDQCRFFQVPVFVKQLGSNSLPSLALKDRKGGEMSEWPDYLRVRQTPKPFSL